MMAETVGFWVMAVVLVGGSLGVVLTPNLFHAAVLYLPAALVATGAIFWLLESPFLFGVQLLLYAGGVVTIVVFAIMLTERLVGQSIRQSNRHVFNGAVLAAAVFVGVVGFVIQRTAPPAPPAPVGEQMQALGRALVGPFGAALQLLAVLLVVALLGALYFARAEDQVPLSAYLILAALVFAIGLFGVLTRRNAVGILLGIELMLNAVNINLVAFARFRADIGGLVFTMLTIAITVAEVAVGLAIVIAIFRVRRTIEADHLDLLRGQMQVGSAALALLVLGLPAASFLLIGVVRPVRRSGRGAAAVSVAAMGGALAAAIVNWQAARPIDGPPRNPAATWSWIPADGGPMATVGVMVDELALPMCVLVTFISFLVQIYSFAYLHDEAPPSLGRYYAYQSLFAFSMLGLVLAPGFLQMFVFWELVGLCSYLLIGFWYDKPSAARAAVKAFWITKLGDLGFVAGIVMLWAATGTFDFWTLFGLADTGVLAAVAGLPTIMFLIYLGAVGKSAQFPLHVWLPDAMEGPTPVSALIHAATMVTAGVYMVARAFPLFALAPDVLGLIAWVGAFTALLAATMACVEADIKRVLAYSTVSQLGYMMASAGAGDHHASFGHLLTHGLFKALLFLGAGVVIHVFHTNDMFRMGGLFARLPWTGVAFLVGTLALAGIPPFPGFFSKEAILAAVLNGGFKVPFAMLALTSLLTAFYMFRAVFLVFFGRAHGHAEGHAVPLAMDGVCRLLALVTVAYGLVLAFGGHHGEAPAWLPWASMLLAVAGIGLAWATYQREMIPASRLSSALAPIDFMARRRYGLDGVYAGLYRVVLLGVSRVVGWIDRYLVDGVLNVLSAAALRAGDLLRRIQTGQPQDYVYGVAVGVLLLLVWAHLVIP